MTDLRGCLILGLCLWLTAGCSLLEDWPAKGGQNATQSTGSLPEAELLFGYLDTLERLEQGSQSAQAELVEEVGRAAVSDPTTSNLLRYAIVLAAPGHVGSDPETARVKLGELLAVKERMLPSESALASLMYRDVNARLALERENALLQDSRATASDQKARDLRRQLESQRSENTRLRQQLEEALAKLEAVAALERSLAERDGTLKGSRP